MGDDGEHCGACRRRLPDEAAPELGGWMRGTLRRQSSSGAQGEPIPLVACPEHHLYTLPRQLRAFAPGEPRMVSTIPNHLMPPYRHCRGCRRPRSEPAPGWARVRVARVDRGALDFELCPDCAAEVR